MEKSRVRFYTKGYLPVEFLQDNEARTVLCMHPVGLASNLKNGDTVRDKMQWQAVKMACKADNEAFEVVCQPRDSLLPNACCTASIASKAP